MAGNAWSMYACGPIEMALLATQGRFFSSDGGESDDEAAADVEAIVIDD